MYAITIDGREYRVKIDQDEFADAPWDNSDGHGPVRRSNRRHVEGESDKRPGERPLNSPSRHEYQYYYDWQAACRTARVDGWNATPYDAPNRVQRAVLSDFDYLRGYLAGDWCYVSVTVTDDETGESDTACGVENIGRYAQDVAQELAEGLALAAARFATQESIERRFSDAMACGV